jgi:hypothetical protein
LHAAWPVQWDAPDRSSTTSRLEPDHVELVEGVHKLAARACS